MQPYQEASAEMVRQGEQPLKLLKIGASAAIPTIAGASIAKKVLPFLNEYITPDLVVKGLHKIDPRLGEFVNKSLSEGKTINDVKDFIKEKISGSAEPESSKNIIEQYSPELHKFIQQKIKQGKMPMHAGALALLDNPNQKGFKKVIEQISKDHNSTWSNIIEMVYGSGDSETEDKRVDTLKKFNQKKSVLDQESDRFHKQYPQQQNIPGPGEKQLMEILNKINQKLGQ